MLRVRVLRHLRRCGFAKVLSDFSPSAQYFGYHSLARGAHPAVLPFLCGRHRYPPTLARVAPSQFRNGPLKRHHELIGTCKVRVYILGTEYLSPRLETLRIPRVRMLRVFWSSPGRLHLRITRCPPSLGLLRSFGLIAPR